MKLKTVVYSKDDSVFNFSDFEFKTDCSYH